MDRMSALLVTLSRLRPDAHVWSGTAPASTDELALKVGPRSLTSEVHNVGGADAAVWLSLLATQSLMHGSERDTAVQLLAEVEAGLLDLGEDARFFAVGTWQISRRGRYWEGLRANSPWPTRRYSVHFSGPYVDELGVVGAIMGVSRDAAFVFAVTEDD